MIPPPSARFVRLAVVAAAVCLWIALPSESHAQRRSPLSFATTAAYATSFQLPRTVAQASGEKLVINGLLLGAIGAFTVGFVGYKIEDIGSDCSRGGGDYCGLGGFVLGIALGESIGIPLGVHWANDSRGSFLTALGTSLLVSSVGILFSGAAEHPLPLLFVPVVQLITSVNIERRTQ